MTVVKKKPVPIYETECPECESLIRYRKSEVSHCMINCPVCGISMWASISPVDYEETEDDNGCGKK